jgi:hypothetical protein
MNQEESISYEQLQEIASYRTLGICKALDIKRERLRDWIKVGHIKPTLPAHGQGTKAGFTLGDVYAIALFKKLTEQGFKRDLSAEIIKQYIGVFNNLIEVVQYILCTRFKKDGEYKMHIMHTLRGDGKDNLTIKLNSETVQINVSDTGKLDWEEMFVFNIIQLRKEVREALES